VGFAARVTLHGQVVDVLLRQHRDIASAEAFFEQALGRSGQVPSAIITDHHQPHIKGSPAPLAATTVACRLS